MAALVCLAVLLASMLWPFGIGGRPPMALAEYQAIVGEGRLLGLTLPDAERVLRYRAEHSRDGTRTWFALGHLGFLDGYSIEVGVNDGRIESAELVYEEF